MSWPPAEPTGRATWRTTAPCRLKVSATSQRCAMAVSRGLPSTWTYMGMDQYLLIPFLVGWTSISQLFWCSPGVQGFDTVPYQLIRMVHIISGSFFGHFLWISEWKHVFHVFLPKIVQIFWVEALHGWTAAAGEVFGSEDGTRTWNEADLPGRSFHRTTTVWMCGFYMFLWTKKLSWYFFLKNQFFADFENMPFLCQLSFWAQKTLQVKLDGHAGSFMLLSECLRSSPWKYDLSLGR